jgi:hypothetical protein
MSKYISSFDLAHYSGFTHDEIIDLLIDNDIVSDSESIPKISQSEYELISDVFDESSQSRINTYFGVQTDVKLQFDLLGGITEIKPRKPKTKVIPTRTWEADDYLPNLEESKNYQYKFFTDLSRPQDEELIFDIEVYGNYFLIMFLGYRTGRCWYFEKTESQELDVQGVKWFIENHTLISFNGIKFDLPLLAIALNNANFDDLWKATKMLIPEDKGEFVRYWEIPKKFGATQLKTDHIDVMEVAPGVGVGLKTYGARIGVPNLQDLPFKVGIDLNGDQISIVRRYCLNDVETTAYLYTALAEEIAIRKRASLKYKLDLRSKSNAQFSEAVIVKCCEDANKSKVARTKNEAPAFVTYTTPSYISFKSELLKDVLKDIENYKFTIEHGEVQPGILSALKIRMGQSVYTMGLGGLHSTEKSVSHYANDGYILMDVDVRAYYPNMMLFQQMFPEKLGKVFIKAFESLVREREDAKAKKIKAVDAMLKVVINSGFGKMLQLVSPLFAPKLGIQTTVGGQLSILMAIEMLELAGHSVISANTDGIVIRLKAEDYDSVWEMLHEWEEKTGLILEETQYKSTHSRDVNCYFAVKLDGSVKRRGSFGLDITEMLKKNPVGLVCTDAVANWLSDGSDIESHIRNCKDVKKFLVVKNVTGGAVKDGEYLGKTVRFYHSTSTSSAIHYAKNGNTVGTSDKCRPMMKLTKDIPIDLDYNWYIDEAYRILKNIGVDCDN